MLAGFFPNRIAWCLEKNKQEVRPPVGGRTSGIFMIIELYGLPGSGKSTLAKKMAEEQGYKIIKIRKRWELVWYNLLFLIKHPYKFIALLVFLIKHTPDKNLLYFKLMNVFFDYNAKYQKALRYQNAIMDQGYCLNTFAIFDNAVSAEEIKKYFKLILKPDKLIILDISFKESLRRTTARGYFAREKFGRDYLKKWQAAIEENNKVFLEIVNELGINYDKEHAT